MRADGSTLDLLELSLGLPKLWVPKRGEEFDKGKMARASAPERSDREGQGTGGRGREEGLV